MLHRRIYQGKDPLWYKDHGLHLNNVSSCGWRWALHTLSVLSLRSVLSLSYAQFLYLSETNLMVEGIIYFLMMQVSWVAQWSYRLSISRSSWQLSQANIYSSSCRSGKTIPQSADRDLYGHHAYITDNNTTSKTCSLPNRVPKVAGLFATLFNLFLQDLPPPPPSDNILILS